jgi:hypothetical protein
MVDLPAVIGSSVAVIGILHRMAANIASPNRFVVSFNRRSSLPYGSPMLVVEADDWGTVTNTFWKD